MGVRNVQERREKLAKKLFKEKFPDRYWSITTPRRVGRDVGDQSATPEEKARFRALADEQIRREENTEE